MQTIHGFREPKVIPEGKISLTQALDLLAKHYKNPKAYKAEDAAKEFKIELHEAKMFLEFYLPVTVVDTHSKEDMLKLGTKTTLDLIQESEEPSMKQVKSALDGATSKRREEEEEKKKKGMV